MSITKVAGNLTERPDLGSIEISWQVFTMAADNDDKVVSSRLGSSF